MRRLLQPTREPTRHPPPVSLAAGLAPTTSLPQDTSANVAIIVTSPKEGRNICGDGGPSEKQRARLDEIADQVEKVSSAESACLILTCSNGRVSGSSVISQTCGRFTQ